MIGVTLQQQAAEYLNQGKYSESIVLYEQCIDANPVEMSNYWHLGLAWLLQGDESLAQAVWLSGLTQGNSEDFEVWTAELIQVLHSLTFRYLQCGNLQAAERICWQILELDPNHSKTYVNLGMIFVQQSQFDEAISHLQKAITLNPDLAEAHQYLGFCLIRTRKSNEAISLLKKAIELNPALPEAYDNLGYCFYDKGQVDEAIVNFKKAIELNPDLPEAYYNLGRCFRDLGNIDEAIANFQEALTLKPDLAEASQRIEELIKYKNAGYVPKNRQGDRTWDAILFKDGTIYRLFYLTGDSRVIPFWSIGELASAISTDLKEWQYLGIILKPDPEHDWESGRILAGNVYKENGIYYLFYSVAPSKSLFEERISLATSVDGIRWNRHSSPFLEPDQRFYGANSAFYQETKIIQCPWRDPYIVKEPNTGKYYMFITALRQGRKPPFQGCIGLAVSNQIDGKYEVLPPAADPWVEGTEESIYFEMERPQVIYKDGKYHLFFSVAPKYVNPKWLEKVGRDRITFSSLYWYASDKITGPFKPVGEKPVVKGSEKTNLYGTNFIQGLDGKWFAYGCYHKSMTLEVSPRFPVRWENGSIEILVS